MGLASPEKIKSLKRTLGVLGGLGLIGTTLYRAYPTAAEQFRRTEALRLYRREDPSTPMPNLTVHASYEKFASEKRADNTSDLEHVKNQIAFAEQVKSLIPHGLDLSLVKALHGMRPAAPPPAEVPPSFFSHMQEGFGRGTGQGIGQGIGMTVADTLIRSPVEGLGGFLKRKLFTGPSQRKAFESATQDENLNRFHQENPGMFDSAHRSLTMFAPEASTDPNIVKNYLNQIMMTRGNVDIATLKLLAETEKALQQTRETARR